MSQSGTVYLWCTFTWWSCEVMVLSRLREIREREALSQEDLAERAGLTRVTVTRLEGGQPARPSTTRRLARALRVRPSDLMEARED
jgi:transcriptional regulator with XRE-family HTH domain